MPSKSKSPPGRRDIPRGAPTVHSAKKCIYFDPDGIRVRTLAIPVVSSLQTVAEYATLECIEPFLRGRELIRGCKVGVTRNHCRYFYMVYTKYQKNTVNCSIREESGNRESWNGPLVVMRLDVTSATRLVSITSKSHKDIAIEAVAKFVNTMNSRISTSPSRRLRWPRML